MRLLQFCSEMFDSPLKCVLVIGVLVVSAPAAWAEPEPWWVRQALPGHKAQPGWQGKTAKLSNHIRNTYKASAKSDAWWLRQALTSQKIRADQKSADHERKAARLSSHIGRTYKVGGRKAARIVDAAFHNANKYGLEPELILAIIAVESTFRERAVSRMGARGLMQVMPRFHPKKVKAIGGTRGLFDPEKNIATGSKILLQYWEGGRSGLRKALMRYNGSRGKAGARYVNKVMRAYQKMRKVTVSG
jgi:soluble lytic murein transglycosylase-like protein